VKETREKASAFSGRREVILHNEVYGAQKEKAFWTPAKLKFCSVPKKKGLFAKRKEIFLKK
jgi:hypothetical protein